jgi:FlgD Ig-like domain
MTRPLVRWVFALLAVATIAAFFVTQQLKSEPALVLRFAALPAYISPNGDGVRDDTEIGFDLSEPASVTFSIVDSEGNEVRRIVDGERKAGDTKHRFRWDGSSEDGTQVPDGTYRLRIVRRDESRVISSEKKITVDTESPQPILLSARPSVIAVNAPGQTADVKLRYRGPVNDAPVFRVWRTDDGPPRIVRRFRGDDTRSGVWHGEVSAGPETTEPAPDGDYAFTVTVRDRAGNEGFAPAEIPTRRSARPGTGVSVQSFSLRGPLGVVPVGSHAALEVGPVDRSFDYALSRLGDPEVLRSGGRVGGRFEVGIPKTLSTGVYVVRVRAGSQRAVWPLAVSGLPQTKAAVDRPRPLLVLPALTWQGLNPVDDDGDGFTDTLLTSDAVRLDRQFRAGRLPAGFDAEISPLLRWLDRERLAYDLTTDLALARREGPALGNAPGVAFAGGEPWLPRPLLRRLRAYVADGGQVATFGTDSFKRSVRLSGDRAIDPSRARPRTVFGEDTAEERSSLAPLEVFDDELGLFAGLSDLVGEFTSFEVSRRLAGSASALTTAGRERETPAFIAFELGDGMVLRTGTSQWARQLEEAALSVEVPQVTKRIWRLLGSA